MLNSLVSALAINEYSILAAISAIMALTVAIIASVRTKTLGGRSLALINLSLATWSIFSALNYLSVDIAIKIMWLKFSYLGVLSLPVFLLFIALEYNHSVGWFHWRRVFVLFIIPFVSCLMIFTNDWHHLVYAEISTVHGDPFLHVRFGWYFWVAVAGYSYLLIFSCLAILVQLAWQNISIYRAQINLMIFSILVPTIGNFLFLSKLLPLPIDPTAILFTITCSLFTLGIYRFQLLDLVPIALKQVTESMGDGILVVDQASRLVYMNPVAVQIFGQGRTKLIGQPAMQALPALTAIMERDPMTTYPHTEISLASSGSLRFYTIRNSPIYDTRQIPSGQVIQLNDITFFKQAQEAFQRAAISEERERLSQELHDHLGQVLHYFLLNTQSIRDQIEQGSYTAALGQLQSLSLIAQSASQDVGQFILNEKAQIAAVGGFSGALKGYVENFEMIAGLRVQVSLPDESINSLLSQESYFSLLRIIQEALAYTRKYAQASLVQIIFSIEEKVLTVVISDDGAGLEKQADHNGVAMENIRRRAQQVGAEMVVRSILQNGTQILLKFPRLLQRGSQDELLGLRVLLADGHPIFLEGIASLLTSRGLSVVGQASTAEKAIHLAAELKPDLMLLDVNLPDQNGSQIVQTIKENSPNSLVVMFSLDADDHALVDSIRAGASGFLLKNQPTDEFFHSLAAIRRGETQFAPGLANQLARRLQAMESGFVRHEQAIQVLHAAGLSQQQIEILEQVALGMLYKEIAAELNLSESSIKYHSDRIQTMLNLSNRSQLVAYAIKIGLAPNRRYSTANPA
jgi:PAS domain S-box-containing protein